MCAYIYMKCWWFLGQTVNLPGYTRKFWVWTVSWAAVRSFESPQGGRLLLPRLLCHCHCAAPNGGLRAKRPVERWNGGTGGTGEHRLSGLNSSHIPGTCSMRFEMIKIILKSCLFIKSGFRPYPFAVSKWECKSGEQSHPQIPGEDGDSQISQKLDDRLRQIALHLLRNWVHGALRPWHPFWCPGGFRMEIQGFPGGELHQIRLESNDSI